VPVYLPDDPVTVEVDDERAVLDVEGFGSQELHDLVVLLLISRELGGFLLWAGNLYRL